jgi:hypothetical protein
MYRPTILVGEPQKNFLQAQGPQTLGFFARQYDPRIPPARIAGMIPLLQQPKRQTIMQYSLRGMLLATLGVAVLCAVIIPLLKYLNLDAADLRWRLGWTAAGAVSTVVFRCVMRYKIEHKCGALLAVITSQSKSSRRWAIAAGFIGGAALVFLGLYEGSSSPAGDPISMNSLFGGCFLASAFLSLWWKEIAHACELCEHGVVADSMRLLPWSSFRGYRRAYDNSLQLLLKHDFFTLRVPPDQEPRVIEIFDTHIPKLNAVEPDRPGRGTI